MSNKSLPKFKSAKVSLVDHQTFDYYNAADEYIGSFTLRHLDFTNPVTKANFAEYHRKSANASNRAGGDTDVLKNPAYRKAYIKTCLVGWNLEDADGKAIPYSSDMALEFFSYQDEDGDSPNDDIFQTIVIFSHNKANFVTKENVSKNS